ncbi:MAG: sulfatase-like hydrolase/transferase [Oligoflexia bacterium]|nr:sulfatase-like hydrolase/transferase [Oligoflexia bacterium]
MHLKGKLMTRLSQNIVLLVSLSLSLACSSPGPGGNGSVIVIAVPSLRADAVNCGALQESITPNLDRLCSEGVRFTHAYTTSVATNAAISSILTGLVPLESGVRTDGVSRYSESVKSLAQLAREKGMETILVSGGVPVLRKSALAKGFGDFDDSVREGGRFYRPAEAVVERFIQLLEDRAEGASFFSVLYFNDLLFPELPGPLKASVESLEGAYNGKLQDIDLAILKLREYLKKRRIWEPTTVVLVGLQGLARNEHESLSKGINLYNEVAQVPLVIKPSTPVRDKVPSWSIDTSVSLADLGVTLFELINVEKNIPRHFKHRSLKPAIEGRGLGENNLPLVIESYLPVLRGWGDVQISLRLGELMFWDGTEPRLFNTYTDRMEQQNLFSKDYTSFKKISGHWEAIKDLYFKDRQPTTLSYSLGEKLRVARNVFSRYTTYESQKQELQELRLRRPDDWQVVQWLIRIAFEKGDWPLIPSVLRDAKPLLPAAVDEKYQWLFTAYRRLRVEPPKNFPASSVNGCLKLGAALGGLTPKEIESLARTKECVDQEVQYWLLSFAASKRGAHREAQEFAESALSLTLRRQEQVEFAKIFWTDGATWDFDPALLEGPSVLDQVLALCEDNEFSGYFRQKRGL